MDEPTAATDLPADEVLATIRARGLGLVCIKTKDGLRWMATRTNDNNLQELSGSTYLGVEVFNDPVAAITAAEETIAEGERRAVERSHTAMVDGLSSGEYAPWPEADGTWAVLRTSDESVITNGISGVREALGVISDIRKDPSILASLKPIKKASRTKMVK